jgi:hypothetical protein
LTINEKGDCSLSMINVVIGLWSPLVAYEC